MKINTRKNNGITLIALIISIILLLILSGISIRTLTGSGLLGKAQEATRISEIKEIEEAARLSYMERQIEEIDGGEKATIAGVISDLKEKGYKIKQTTGGANIITGIALSEENVTVERNTEKTVTYTLVYSDNTTVRYFVEVQGKDYEIIFNNGDITINTEETNLGELSKEPEVTVTSSNNNIIEANKTEEGKIVLTAKNEIGDVEITIKETNSSVTKTFSATTRIPAIGLTISQTSATVEVGKTIQLTATAEPSNTTDTITWTSSNTAIATVTNAGLVTGVNSGTATITVTCGSQSKTCTVKVERFSGINTSITNPEGALPSGTVTVVEANASKGIVIKDKNNMEWVWIQVPKTTVFKTAKSSTDYTNIKKDLITYAGVYRKGASNQNYSWDDTWYDGCGVANATTYTTMYNKMLKSVYTNGGFWIQRYEDGRININIATAQNYASQMSPDEIKTSSLLFGIQWDLVCKYLEVSVNWSTPPNGKANAYYLNENSSSWGRYSDTSGNSPLAGQDRNKKMNIYDFAGNREEYTLENTLKDGYHCAIRGGCYSYAGSVRPASHRQFLNATIYGSNVFRTSFY